jgi:serine/threonine protein kinase
MWHLIESLARHATHMTHVTTQDLADFLLQCWRKDPLERPTAKQLLEHPWLRIAHQSDVQAGVLYIHNIYKKEYCICIDVARTHSSCAVCCVSCVLITGHIAGDGPIVD